MKLIIGKPKKGTEIVEFSGSGMNAAFTAPGMSKEKLTELGMWYEYKNEESN